MRYSVLVILLLALSMTAVRSQERQIVEGGRTYLLHTVKKGETVSSISESYKIDRKELLSVNSDLLFGLREGQLLKIPVDDDSVSVDSGAGDHGDIEQAVVQQKEPSFTQYKVKRRDSIHFIANRFGIEVEDILRYNPWAVNGIKRGQVLRIPDRRDMAEIKAMEEQGKQQTGVAIGDSEDGVTAPEDKGQEAVAGYADGDDCRPDIFAAHRRYNVGLLLPFYLTANDTINRLREQTGEMLEDTVPVVINGNMRTLPSELIRRRPEPVVYPPSDSYLHFYEGVLMAADSLRQAGMFVELHVFDTNQSPRTVDSLLMSGRLDNLDLIIGPVFTVEQNQIAEFAYSRRIPIVSPLASGGNVEDHNPYFYKVNPTKDYLIKRTASYVGDRFRDKNVIILKMENYQHLAEAEFVQLCREQLSSASLMDKDSPYMIREYDFYAEGAEGLAAILSEEIENVFIIPSETEAQLSVALTALNAFAGNYNIALVGFSSFQRYKSIQTEYFHRVNLSYLSPYFVDYRSPVVTRFVEQFRHNFAAEPTQFSFQGYDVAFYFLSALFTYGKDFAGCLPLHHLPLTQCDFDFGRVNDGGGFMNRGLFITEYAPDYSINVQEADY